MYFLVENKDMMYTIWQGDTSLGRCDILSAEEFHTAMIEQGYPVCWVYMDDTLQQRRFSSKIVPGGAHDGT